MKRLKLLRFVSLIVSFPFSCFMDTNLMINTIQAISNAYHFQYFLILSSAEKAQRVEHENVLKMLHSRIKLSTIVDISIDNLDKYKEKILKWKKSNTETRNLIVFNCINEFSRKEFVKFIGNLKLGGNRIWLLFFPKVEKSLEKFLNLLKIRLNSQLILAVMESSKYVSFKAPYRVAKNFPLRIADVGNYSDSDGLNLPFIDIAMTRMDLEGLRLRAGTSHYPPMSTVIYRKDGQLTSVGFLADIWNELSERLNFTYDYYLSEDGSTGAMLPGGTWSGLVGMLINKKIDVAVLHVSITKQRMKYVDFGVPIIFNRKKIFFLDIGNQFEWGNLFRPFSIGVWIGLLLWFVVISIALAYFFKMECLENTMKHTALFKRECLILGFSTALRAITNQGSDVIPRSLSSRIVFYFAYLTMVVVLPSYSAALISYLTVQTPYKPFDSIKSMLDKGTHYLAVTLNTSDYSYFAESTNPMLQNVLKKLIIPYAKKGPYPKNTEEGIHLVCHNKNVAFFGNNLQGELFSDIEFNRHGCKIASIETAVISAGESFAFRKGSPYTQIFNSELKKIVYRGLLGHLQKEVYLKNQQNFNASGYEEINFRHVTQIYSLFLGGFILALIVFAIEILINRRNKCKVIDQNLKIFRKVSNKGMKLCWTRKRKSKN